MLTFIIIITIIQLYIVIMSLRRRDLYENKYHKNKVLFLIIGTLSIPIIPLLFINSKYWTIKWTKYPTEIEIYKLVLSVLEKQYKNKDYIGICYAFTLVAFKNAVFDSKFVDHIMYYSDKFRKTEMPSIKNNLYFYKLKSNSQYGYWFEVSEKGSKQRIAFVKHIINKLENESNATKNVKMNYGVNGKYIMML